MGGKGSHGSPERLSRLQKMILAELETYKEKYTHISVLSLKVAMKYGTMIDLGVELMKELMYEGIARDEQDALQLIKNMGLAPKKRLYVTRSFSASFSRSLRNLEEKGLIKLYYHTHESWETFYWDYHGPYGKDLRDYKQPRVYLVFQYNSPYFERPESYFES